MGDIPKLLYGDNKMYLCRSLIGPALDIKRAEPVLL